MTAPPAAPDLIRRHHRAITLVGVTLLLAGAWMLTAAYNVPWEERHVSTMTIWSEHDAFSYRVPVTRNSTHWPIGTELPMGEPAYFRTISDRILVDYSWIADTPADARGVAAGRLDVQVRAQSADGRPYWSLEHTLAEATAQDVQQGIALSGIVDLDELMNEVSVVSRELPPGDAVVNWSVRAVVTYSIEMGERHEQGQTERILSMSASDPRFVLPRPEELRWDNAHTEESTSVTAHLAGMPGALRSLRGMGLAALGIAAVGLGAWAARTVAQSGFETEYRRFRDWVSAAGSVPEGATTAGTLVEVTSLEDLVHVAADARTRVVLDSSSRIFYALLPGVTYRYARHATPPR